MLDENLSEDVSGSGNSKVKVDACDDGLEEDRQMIAATKMMAKSISERASNESFNSVEKENLNLENSKKVACLPNYRSDYVEEDDFDEDYESAVSNPLPTLSRTQQKSPMRRLQKKLPLLRCKSPSRVNRDASADLVHNQVSAKAWQKIREDPSRSRLPPPIPTQALKKEEPSHTLSTTDSYSHKQPQHGSLLSNSISALQSRVISSNEVGDKTRERLRNEKSRTMAAFLRETTLMSAKSSSSSCSSSEVDTIEPSEHSTDNDEEDEGDASASTHSSHQRHKDEFKPYATEICKALASSSRSSVDRSHSNENHLLSTRVRYTFAKGGSTTGASSNAGGGQDGTESVSTYSAISRSHSVSTYSARSLSLSEISSTVADRKKFLQDVLAKSDVFDRNPQQPLQKPNANSPVKCIAQKFGGVAERKSTVRLRREELERQWQVSQMAQPRVPQAKWQPSSNGSYKKRVVLVERKQQQQQQQHYKSI